jgi:hypothetical protein
MRADGWSGTGEDLGVCRVKRIREAARHDPDTTEFHVVCPYCGEEVEVYLEPDVQGTLVIDCEVCCRPWQVHVMRDNEYRYLDVTRGDGSE